MLQKINNEVYIATDSIIKFDLGSIEFLRDAAIKSSRGRVRICAHKKAEDLVHEMIIAITSNSYVRPHKHLKKMESFHLVEGAADVVIFSDSGDIIDVIGLGSNRCFYYRLDHPFYHTLLVHSEVLIIHETTNGPFDTRVSDLATFAPEEGTNESLLYVSNLKKAVEFWKKRGD